MFPNLPTALRRESRCCVRSRVLGIAFLLQFVTSLAAGFLLNLIAVPGNILETLSRIAAHPFLMRANILLEMVTAGGVIWLGALLFAALRRHGETMARLAFALYILEAALLAVSRVAAFTLVAISLDYVNSGHSASRLTEGSLAFALMNSGYLFLMLSFSAGAFLFYWLLFQSRVIPRPLSLWGLLALVPLSIATILTVLGISAPFYLYVPYIPFEFVVGLWILIAGLRPVSADPELPMRDA
jgi:hypothetical protein